MFNYHTIQILMGTCTFMLYQIFFRSQGQIPKAMEGFAITCINCQNTFYIEPLEFNRDDLFTTKCKIVLNNRQYNLQ
jgi:hypothetical protein